MSKNKFQLLTIVNTMLLLLVVVCFMNFYSSPKVVCVDNMKLFEGFYMTKEMKQVGEKQIAARKAILDSLYSKIQSGKVSGSEKESMMKTFLHGKEELELFNQNFATEETSKIWSRIHGYVDEFSKENNYQLILGSENKESVLHANENYDITSTLLTYINKKYEGAK